MPWRYHMTNLIELMEGFILRLKHSIVKMSVIIDIFIALRAVLSASITAAAYNKLLIYCYTLVIHYISGYITGFFLEKCRLMSRNVLLAVHCISQTVC